MQCKFIKLSNGDDLIVTTDDGSTSLTDREYLDVVDPVLINTLRFPRGSNIIETYVMQPWIKMAKSDTVHIPTKNIVVMVDLHESAEQQYKMYIMDTYRKATTPVDNFVEPTDEELSSILNHLVHGDDEVDDEEDDDNEHEDTRTLH